MDIRDNDVLRKWKSYIPTVDCKSIYNYVIYCRGRTLYSPSGLHSGLTYNQFLTDSVVSCCRVPDVVHLVQNVQDDKVI